MMWYKDRRPTKQEMEEELKKLKAFANRLDSVIKERNLNNNEHLQQNPSQTSGQ